MTTAESADPPIAALAAILDEEMALYRRLEALAAAQAEALREDALDRLGAISAEQLALIAELHEQERRRRDLVEPGATLTDLIAAWGAPADVLAARRDALLAQIERVREANARNRALIATLLDYQRERLQLALHEQALYDADGQVRPAPLRGLVDRRA
ncbi:MAG: flagellar export chaperone FlgN [Chloroflexota bacterium]|nr:flagellar protein FlgN [Dehalococcoidia bacterium]MDW8254882.1 flagellar export chaperone FlgN [Chloroflexota bacterium]